MSYAFLMYCLMLNVSGTVSVTVTSGMGVSTKSSSALRMRTVKVAESPNSL